MTKKEKIADDPRFHRRLFGTLSDYNPDQPPCLIYVENGNAIAGYDQLASDYKMAADLIIATEQESQLGNWNAPLIFMVRQTLELSLKALLEATNDWGNEVDPTIMLSHRLDGLWGHSRVWLEKNGYPILEDNRYETAEWMIANFNAVDPTGDLFRFAYSKITAFGRHKTYDRAGATPSLIPYFDTTFAFLSHWTGVLVMEWMEEQARLEGFEYHRPTDPDDFPRTPTKTS